MTYERFRLGRQKIRYDNANDDLPLVYQFAVNDAKQTATSATIAISFNGTEKLAATAATVSGSLISYTLDTSTETTWLLGKGYRADLVVTYDTKTYERHFFFDIATYVFVPHLTHDQLVALDDNVRGMDHDGDEDFSELIGACRDIMQTRLESKMLEATRLKQEMIVDPSQVAVAFRSFVLSRIYRNKGNHEQANEYKAEYQELLDAALSTTPFDKGETGSEGATAGGIQETRLET